MLISYAHIIYEHVYVYQGPMPDGVTCCPKNHFGFLASGKMKVMMVETGEEQIISAGEAYYVPPKVCVYVNLVLVVLQSEYNLICYLVLYFNF